MRKLDVVLELGLELRFELKRDALSLLEVRLKCDALSSLDGDVVNVAMPDIPRLVCAGVDRVSFFVCCSVVAACWFIFVCLCCRF
jgi:hypothetical protein